MLMSRRKYAEHRGVTEAAVRCAIRDGRITTTNGKIDPAVADRQWAANTNPAYHPPHGDSDAESRRAMSTREKKDALDIMLKKLEYDERSGKLVSLAEVRADAFAASRLVRDKMNRLTDRVAPMLIGKNDIAEFKKILQQEITDCLKHLEDLYNGNQS